MPEKRHPHLIVDQRFHSTKDYRSRPRPQAGPSIPFRNRETHARQLQKVFDESWKNAETANAVSAVTRTGVYLEFKSDPDASLVTKSLEDLQSKKVRLLNVREEEGEDDKVTTFATVFVANEKREHFLNKLEKYADPEQDLSYEDKPDIPRHADLINSIADIRGALSVEFFWTDEASLIPGDDSESVEVWLSSDSDETETQFRELCEELEVPVEAGSIRFPERKVVVVEANREQLEQLSLHSDDIAEYRRAKETAAFWLEQENADQTAWVQELLDRLNVASSGELAVCILDSGTNRGHPLLSPILDDPDCHTYESRWGTADRTGHGTLMAGVAGYGNLQAALESSALVELTHVLESVKIIPDRGQNPEKLWGYITAQGISLAEIQAADRNRVVCLAITAEDSRDEGRPSSWSGEIDQLASGTDGGDPRLIIVAAGNLAPSTVSARDYPDPQKLESIHDPAQAWNALTIGAVTELDQINDPQLDGYRPVATAGGLSPFSTTSVEWDEKWPLKPDVLFEGGNLSIDDTDFFDESDDLCVLSTYHDITKRLLEKFNMTSAATAKASWMAAKIMAEYPEYWPETIRALLVHSARWTPALEAQFLGTRNPSKEQRKQLIRICGWGVPDLDRALYTAENSLTLVSEATLQPFQKTSGRISMNDMRYYELPWPTDALLDLAPEVEVSMRITLSYFIEPGPGEIGWKDRYRYPSHALRFSIIRPEETPEDFQKRISSALEEEEDDINTAGNSSRWVLGRNARHKGSVHSDYWKGTAAELAASNFLAVYPVTGWWKERSYLGKAESRCRFSLIVSIETEAEEVDLYTPVATQIGIPVAVEV